MINEQITHPNDPVLDTLPSARESQSVLRNWRSRRWTECISGREALAVVTIVGRQPSHSVWRRRSLVWQLVFVEIGWEAPPEASPSASSGGSPGRASLATGVFEFRLQRRSPCVATLRRMLQSNAKISRFRLLIG